MEVVTRLAPYQDDRGNKIEYDGEIDEDKNVWVRMQGANNRLVVAKDANLRYLKVWFDCDNALVQIGPSKGVPALSLTVRAGQDSTVRVGRNVSCTSRVFLSAAEGTTVLVGDDVMLSTGNEMRADDAHAIFDVRTRKRVNVSRSISIGNHVWLAREAIVLGGVTIGDGAVIGYRSIVTRPIPNNCLAVGIPAKVVRRDIAWERPHVDRRSPYQPDASTVEKLPYWNLTQDDAPLVLPLRRRVGRRAARVARRLRLRR